MATIGYTYDNATRKEDVSDVVYDLSVQEGFLLKALPKVKASNTLHEFIADTLAAAVDNANIEGSDFSAGTIVQPSRKNNITQIFRKDIQVSRTERTVDHYGMTDPFEFQKAKKLKEMANDMEFALIRGTIASGTGTAARRLRGLVASITTNATALASAQTLTEAILGGGVQLAYDQGANIDHVFAGMKLKRQMSKFTANSTRYIDADSEKLNSIVEIYMSDASTKPIKLVPHRFMPGAFSGDGTNAVVIGIDSEQFAIAELETPFFEPIAKTGDHERGMAVSEVTLEDRNEKGGFKLTNVHYDVF